MITLTQVIKVPSYPWSTGHAHTGDNANPNIPQAFLDSAHLGSLTSLSSAKSVISALSVKSDSGVHNSKRKEEGGALQDKAVRRDWFSETQLRDGHKKDESEKKGIKSLGESQTNNPRFQKFSFTHLCFSGVLECDTKGWKSEKPWSPLQAKRRGESKGQQSQTMY